MSSLPSLESASNESLKNTEKSPPSVILDLDHLDHLNQNHLTLKSSDLAEKIRARRLYIREAGLKVFGTSPECSPKRVPVWFDQKAFKRGQTLYRIYGPIISLTQFYGLMLVLRFYEALAPLLVTGNSSTISRLFSRYLSSSVHLTAWYTDPGGPFDPASRAYRSLKIVRGLHLQIGPAMNRMTGGLASVDHSNEFSSGDLWISQWSMMQAQFSFIGLMAVFPKELGFSKLTTYDRHCLLHLWRVFGYCLGVEDRFNLCSAESYEETAELCRQIYYEEWLPKILKKEETEETGRAMGEGIAQAMSAVLPGVSRYRAIMRFAAPIFGLPKEEDYELRGVLDYLAYALIWFTVRLSSRSVIASWTLCRLFYVFNRLAIWCRRFHEWTLEKRYPETKVNYQTDSRCPLQFIARENFNYRTAWEHRLT